MLMDQPKAKGQLLRGTKIEPREETKTLSDLGIEKKLSSSSQKTAALPQAEFEARVAVGRERC